MNREDRLIWLAQGNSSEYSAKLAMKHLREYFDETYMWCEDCDGLVCKEKDCCLNREPLSQKEEEELIEWFKKQK